MGQRQPEAVKVVKPERQVGKMCLRDLLDSRQQIFPEGVVFTAGGVFAGRGNVRFLAGENVVRRERLQGVAPFQLLFFLCRALKLFKEGQQTGAVMVFALL